MSKTMTRLFKQFALAGVLALASTAAHAQDVGYNFMPGTDFTKYKTYRWVKIEGQQYPDDITDAQIKQASDAQLALKGLTKTDAEQADLYIGYRVALGQEKQMNAYTTGGYGGGMTTATTTTITVGTLSLDMYDPAVKQLVWRGTASKTVDVKANAEKRTKNLNKAMGKMLKNYPPKQK